MRRMLLAGLALVPALLLSNTAMAATRRPRVEFTAGAGFGSFTGDLGNVTDSGFAWGGRLGIQFMPVFGLEIGYQGLNSSFSDVVLPNGVFSGDFSILQQAISLNARAGVPIPISDTQIYLYGLAGAGYSNIWMSQGGFLVGTSSDSAFLVPLGGGPSFIFPGGLLLDGRYTYNLLSGDRSPVVKTGNSWTVLFSVGGRFAM